MTPSTHPGWDGEAATKWDGASTWLELAREAVSEWLKDCGEPALDPELVIDCEWIADLDSRGELVNSRGESASPEWLRCNDIDEWADLLNRSRLGTVEACRVFVNGCTSDELCADHAEAERADARTAEQEMR